MVPKLECAVHAIDEMSRTMSDLSLTDDEKHFLNQRLETAENQALDRLQEPFVARINKQAELLDSVKTLMAMKKEYDILVSNQSLLQTLGYTNNSHPC